MRSQRRLTFLHDVKPWAGACLALALVALFGPTQSWAAIIKTNVGTGADAELREAASGNGSNRGNAGDMNSRFISGTNDELFLLRFDLAAAGINPAQVTAASLNLTSTRAGNANGSNRIWGLVPGAANQNWGETTTNFSNFSGVTNDNNLTTVGVDPLDPDVAALGLLSWTTAPTAGQVLSFNPAALATFLQGAGPTVTFIVEMGPSGSTSQQRYASKESSALGSTANPDNGTGVFAPFLDVTVVPEPASMVLMGLCSLAVAGVRRRTR
jgi:hypothetical protein